MNHGGQEKHSLVENRGRSAVGTHSDGLLSTKERRETVETRVEVWF